MLLKPLQWFVLHMERSLTAYKRWYQKFRQGDFSLEDACWTPSKDWNRRIASTSGYYYVRLPSFESGTLPLHRLMPTDYIVSFILYDFLHREYIGKDSVRAEQMAVRGNVAPPRALLSQTSFENVRSAQVTIFPTSWQLTRIIFFRTLYVMITFRLFKRP